MEEIEKPVSHGDPKNGICHIFFAGNFSDF
jgi:hypothetical protein